MKRLWCLDKADSLHLIVGYFRQKGLRKCCGWRKFIVSIEIEQERQARRAAKRPAGIAPVIDCVPGWDSPSLRRLHSFRP
jgi:hypothetical protein